MRIFMDQLQIVLCVSSMLSVYGVFPRAFRMNSSLVKKLYSREQAGIPAVWNSILAPVVSCGALQATCLGDSLSTQPESEVISGSREARTALFDGPWPWVSVNSFLTLPVASEMLRWPRSWRLTAVFAFPLCSQDVFENSSSGPKGLV